MKRTDAVGNWFQWDTERSPVNSMRDIIVLNENGVELGLSQNLFMLSNGIKLQMSHPSYNASGGTFVFAAFAESPFKTARAR